ncbi:hypothetical protein BGZ72_003457 [Mortierella alpina]|nr:hypothetical protein BGZ72_003457 [Mortierella alpina]
MFSSPMLLDFNSNSKRSKITKACDNCRRRRVKCDGVPDGCGGCKAAKTQCVYTTSNTKRGPPKGYVEVIEDRLGKIENMLAGIVRKKTVLVSQNSSDRATPSHSDNEDNHDDDDDQGSIDSSDLVHVKKQPSSPVLRPARSSTPNVSSFARSGSVAVSTQGRHSPLVSRNRSLTTLLPFSQNSQLHDPHQDPHADMAALTSMFDNMGTTSVRTTVPFPWLTPEQSHQYGRNHLQFSSQSLEPPLPTLARPFSPTTSPDTTLQLLNNFFNHFNAHLPIVDRPTFMRQWQQASCQLCQPAASGAGVSQPKTYQKQQQHDVQAHNDHLQHPSAPLSPLLLNALLAVASRIPADAKQTPEKASALSQGFFDAARLLLDDFMDVPRVSTVQALCLMSQFHHQGEWRTTRSSSYLAMAIRMAHELGLNRDPEMAYAPEADALRYLWWSMFILDHLFSAWLGLGLLMHGKESDVELPATFVSSSIELRGFICMVRLVKILGTVLQHSYSTQSLPPQFGGHDSMVSYIEGSLTSWLSNLAPDMRWQNPNIIGMRRLSPGSPMRSPRQRTILSDATGAAALGKECSDIYPSYLYIVYNTTLILLHRPYIVGAAGSPAAAQSNTICTGSGRAITDIAQGLDLEHCSYVVNRFAVYALLQAGVIHAMNAVYDKRGSEAAMEYFQRTIRVLEGFLVYTAYSGGVAEGIKILEQFLATTSAAAEEEDSKDIQETSVDRTQELTDGQANRGKKRQLETGTSVISPSTSKYSPGEHQPSSHVLSASTPGTSTQPATASSTLSSQSTIEQTARPSTPSYVFDYDQQQLQQQRIQRQALDMKEQQKQQQLKIQQQHRMYQQMQTFGAGAVKIESKAESDLQKLGQQQQQQQLLLRQQLQRQQQRQQQEMELKEHNASAAAAVAAAAATNQLHAPPTMAAPVIPSHRHAMQLLQQQQHQQQQHQQQHYLQQGQPGHVNMPMTMTMAAMTMDTQGKMNQDFAMNGTVTSGAAGYDPTQFWVDFSATDQAMPCANGSINPVATETTPNNPLWM